MAPSDGRRNPTAIVRMARCYRYWFRKALVAVLGLVLLLSLTLLDVTSIRSVRYSRESSRMAYIALRDTTNRHQPDDEWVNVNANADSIVLTKQETTFEIGDANHSTMSPTRSPIRSPNPSQQQQQSGKVLCIEGPFWGQTFNRIIQTANALTLAGEKGAVAVGLDTKWTEWYGSFLDPRPDVRFNYTGPCTWSLTPKEVFRYYKFDMQHSLKYLQQLAPKAVFRAEARAALTDLKRPVTTVHRRNLEGKCVGYARNFTKIVCADWKAARKGLSVQNLVDICNLEYSMIANQTKGTSVILMTDSQVPQLDQTFAHISNHSFPVQTWMMALSDIHYGNPFSTVDLIVHFWRIGLGKGKTSIRPNACYRPAAA